MYKMVAIDLDDTLLTDDLTISPHTLKVIHQAAEQGIIITIATGRMFPSAKPFAEQLKLNVPLITYQGALIKDLEGKEILYERLLPPETVRKLITLARDRNLHLQLYQDDILYASSDNEFLRQYIELTDAPYLIEKNLDKLAEKGCTKALIIDNPGYLNALQDELRYLMGNQVYITKSKPAYLEVMHCEANKGVALLHLAKKFGVKQEEIIGIGDSYNDIELITMAGLGVAMGNGVDTLKEQADYISYSNNDEGISHIIEKFILQPTLSKSLL